MRLMLAIFLPPFALIGTRRPFQFLFNLTVWLISLPAILFMGVGFLGWLFCTIHALIVSGSALTDRRVDRVVRAIETNRPHSAQGVPEAGRQA